MARRRTEPTRLTRVVIDAVHNDQRREHGGLPGVRDENGLESALARPQNKWHFASDADVPALAAACAYGLVQNHPYRDGNKRIGFLAMATFLGMNGYDPTATDEEVVSEFVALADGRIAEDQLTRWVRERVKKHR